MKVFRNGQRKQSGKFYANGRRVRKEPALVRGLSLVTGALGRANRPMEKLAMFFASDRGTKTLLALLGACGMATAAAVAYFAYADGGFAAQAGERMSRAETAMIAGFISAGVVGMVVPAVTVLAWGNSRQLREQLDKSLDKQRAKPRSLIDARDITRMRRQRQQRRRP